LIVGNTVDDRGNLRKPHRPAIADRHHDVAIFPGLGQLAVGLQGEVALRVVQPAHGLIAVLGIDGGGNFPGVEV